MTPPRYQDTGFLYTDASLRYADERVETGYGAVGRIGNRLVARAGRMGSEITTSDKAEVEAALRGIALALVVKPKLKQLTILTDNEGVQRYLSGTPAPEWLSCRMESVLEGFERRGCRLIAIKVKGHSIEDEHANGNGMAHHLAMLGRNSDPVDIDLPYRKDWLSVLWRSDRRLDSIPLPPFVDVKLAMRVLELDHETILKLIAGRHMQYDFAYGGIRRKSIEAIRAAMREIRLSKEAQGTVDIVSDPRTTPA